MMVPRYEYYTSISAKKYIKINDYDYQVLVYVHGWVHWLLAYSSKPSYILYNLSITASNTIINCYFTACYHCLVIIMIVVDVRKERVFWGEEWDKYLFFWYDKVTHATTTRTSLSFIIDDGETWM